MELSTHKKAKIVLVSVPLHGHAIPVLKIADALQRRGHDVTYVSSASSTARVKAQYPTLEMISLNDRIEEMACRVKPNVWFAEIMSWCDELRKIVKQIGPDIIVTDMMTMPGAKIANELGIKLAANLPMPIEMCDFFGMPSFTNTINIFGVNVLTYKLKYLLMTLFVRESRNGCQLYSTRSLILMNTFFGLEEARALPPNLKLVGPLRTQ
jgi:UDP:flavonoid glycosyltransferase YjiC (YdhE family)